MNFRRVTYLRKQYRKRWLLQEPYAARDAIRRAVRHHVSLADKGPVKWRAYHQTNAEHICSTFPEVVQ